MEVSGQLHAPPPLPPAKGFTSIHWIRGWVGPRAGLHYGGKEKNSSSVHKTATFIQSIVPKLMALKSRHT